MSISFVNGYLCTSSCDAAKARAGQNPHPQDATNQTPNARPDSPRTPAVAFGGALAGQNAVAPAAAANSPTSPRIDMQA